MKEVMSKDDNNHEITYRSKTVIQNELSWLSEVLLWHLNGVFNTTSVITTQKVVPAPPDIYDSNEYYGTFIKTKKLNRQQRLVLILSLAPHLQSDFFDKFIQENVPKAGDFPQLGGVRGKNFRGFLPTGETALFLLAGDDMESRFEAQIVFDQDSFFAKQQVLWLEDAPLGEPVMSGKIIISQEYVEQFTLGMITKPRFGINFPAQQIDTQMDWDDLVLPTDTLDQINDLESWIKYGSTLLNEWGMGKKLKPGYRVLFHGPPGTGKTLTASLLGKYTGKEVYKIDLSMVVSKFIGETEKNLANLFDKAENKDWILFFDEADALFGKRTSVRDAHDKYANQEVSFLLQRTESYAGLVILATNFKSNIDDAFTRRFQSHIYFPTPKYKERLELWKKAFPKNIKLEQKIDLSSIARQFELTGAHIMNIVQYTCLQVLSRNQNILCLNDLISGIRKELSKEGKVV